MKDRGGANAYSKTIEWVAHKLGLLGSGVMVAIMLLTVIDVVLRFVFNSPLVGTLELTEIAMVALIFFAIPWAASQKVNVRVDILVNIFSSKIKKLLESISCLLSLCIAALWAWFAIPQAVYMKELGQQSDMLRIPIYPFYIIIVIGFGMLALVWLGDAVALIKSLMRGRKTNER